LKEREIKGEVTLLKNSNIKKYVIAVILPLIILISMTINPLITYYRGQEITIETRPYDPRDVFRGDHVVLNYKINEIDINKVPVEFKQEVDYNKLRGKKLYTVLKKSGNYYEVDYATFEKPKDKLYLNCKYEYSVWDDEFKSETSIPKIKAITVSYNLDKYFVPENTGKELEELSAKGYLTAKVKVWNGYAYLVDIY
jgi:uncharacterized membrane-anchored protein